MTSERFSRRRISILVVLVLLTGACGGATTTTTTIEISDPSGPPYGLTAAARDFEFIPDSWTVPSGALLVVDFDNEGALDHLFVVIKDRLVVDSSAGFDDSLVFRELRAAPGESVSDTFMAPTVPGSYQVVCTIPGHIEAGMIAELIVEA
jgi:uncharacterized cupredoxin-like copper-binding protein